LQKTVTFDKIILVRTSYKKHNHFKEKKAMFGLGKNKKQLSDDNKLYVPVTGTAIDLSLVSDPIFAKKVMGDGFAIEPTGEKIVSPAAGEVTMLQGHAVGMIRADGLHILLHLGIDTVSLNGAPFKLNIKKGDILEGGEEIGTADWKQVEAAGVPKTTLVLITNSAEEMDELTVEHLNNVVEVGQEIGKVTAK
jgi:glucose-specific phosphotransferase system IIA component